MCSGLLMRALFFVIFGIFAWTDQALAQDKAGTQIGVSGQAQSLCVVHAPQASAASNMHLIQPGSDASAIAITKLTDGPSARLLPASINLKFRVICNAPHYVSLRSVKGGLRPQSVQSVLDGTFLSHVNYRGQVWWANQMVELVTAGTADVTTPGLFVGGGANGELRLDIQLQTEQGSDLPLSAGAYSDTLIMTIATPL